MNLCKDCALRLFNDKGHNINGIGNIWSGNALVLPNVDRDAYKKQDMSFSSQVEILNTISSTGGIEANLYIVPLIRCNVNEDIEITNDIIKRCTFIFVNIATKYQLKNIMLCGDAARQYLHIDDIAPYLDTIIFDTKNKVKYFVNYSPLVKYTNDKLYNSFISHFIKYYNSIINGFYDYDIMNI